MESIEILSREFSKFIKSNKEFLVAYDIVKKNCSGNIYLVGGGLSRNLSNIIHKTNNSVSHDFDFIVESPLKVPILPEGWRLRTNKFKGFKFVGPDFDIDFMDSNNLFPLKRRGLKFSIETFLHFSPFTPQAIIYDIDAERILGEIGLNSLKEKSFGVNSLEDAKIYAEKKEFSVKELLFQKAKSMDFIPDLKGF